MPWRSPTTTSATSRRRARARRPRALEQRDRLCPLPNGSDRQDAPDPHPQQAQPARSCPSCRARLRIRPRPAGRARRRGRRGTSSAARIDNRGWSLYGARRLQLVAIRANRRREKTAKHATTVAVGCHRLPQLILSGARASSPIRDDRCGIETRVNGRRLDADDLAAPQGQSHLLSAASLRRSSVCIRSRTGLISSGQRHGP